MIIFIYMNLTQYTFFSLCLNFIDMNNCFLLGFLLTVETIVLERLFFDIENSDDFIFSWLHFVANSLSSAFKRVFNTLQYFLGLILSVKTLIISIIEKYHFSFCESH